MDSEKRKRDIAEWISRPHKPPSSNEDEEAEGEEIDVSATQASTKDNSLIKKYNENREYDREDDRKDTELSNTKSTEEEASSVHEDELLSLNLLERSGKTMKMMT